MTLYRHASLRGRHSRYRCQVVFGTITKSNGSYFDGRSVARILQWTITSSVACTLLWAQLPQVFHQEFSEGGWPFTCLLGTNDWSGPSTHRVGLHLVSISGLLTNIIIGIVLTFGVWFAARQLLTTMKVRQFTVAAVLGACTAVAAILGAQLSEGDWRRVSTQQGYRWWENRESPHVAPKFEYERWSWTKERGWGYVIETPTWRLRWTVPFRKSWIDAIILLSIGCTAFTVWIMVARTLGSKTSKPEV